MGDDWKSYDPTEQETEACDAAMYEAACAALGEIDEDDVADKSTVKRILAAYEAAKRAERSFCDALRKAHPGVDSIGIYPDTSHVVASALLASVTGEDHHPNSQAALVLLGFAKAAVIVNAVSDLDSTLDCDLSSFVCNRSLESFLAEPEETDDPDDPPSGDEE